MDNFNDAPLMSAAELVDNTSDFLLVRTPAGDKRLALDTLIKTGKAYRRKLLLPAKAKTLSALRLQNATTVDGSFTVGAVARDFHLTAMAEASYDAAQLIFLSGIAANNVAGATAAIAPSANLASLNTPSGGNGAWLTFLWSGAGSVTIPNGTPTAFAAIASDWLSVQSIARDDSPVVNIPIFMLRTHFPPGGGAFVYSGDTSTSNGFSTDAQMNYRRYLKFTQTNIDGVGTPANFTANTDSNVIAAHVIRFRHRVPVLNIMGVGDSLMSGSKTVGGVFGGLFRAMLAESGVNIPISYTSCARGGSLSSTYLADFKILAPLVQPHVAMYNAYSPNDTAFNQAMVNTELGRVADFIATCHANDILPVICTPTPVQTDSLTVTNLKIAMTATLNDLGTKDILVIDRYNAATDFTVAGGGSGNGWKSGYNDADGIHGNDTWALVDRELMRATIQQLVVANF